MDPKFTKDSIFYRRREEMSNDNVKECIDKIFSNISLLEGWTFVSSSWSESLDERKRSEELKKHVVNIISIKIKEINKEDGEHVYNIQIPKLINNQFFYIGGLLKIPIFQLTDYPVIYRAAKKIIKVKTNTVSITINTNRNKDGDIGVFIFNKIVPLTLLLACYYKQEEFEKFFDKTLKNDENLLWVKEKCINYWNTYSEKELIEKLGNYYKTSSAHDKEKKGRSILFSLNAAYEVDFFNRPFFKTSSILFEILNALHEGPRSDTDVFNKRIRFLEYILQPLIYKFYGLLLTVYNNKKSKFKIAQNVVLENCNVSEIVHFNFPLNPIDEIASIIQCTLTGPGGFKKDNVPAHLRNLDDSQFGVFCPADTPDRDGCGVILNLIPTTELDSLGRIKSPSGKIITSYPISLVPFLKNDDQTRLQMASGQMKQSLFLKNSQKPLIKSGTESCYLDHSNFLYRAKRDGRVIYLDNNYMIVTYRNGWHDIIQIGYKNLYLNSVDYIQTYKKEGETFKRNEIICESKFLKDGELSLGQNLLTAITIWKGFNYEDGIVISESTAKKKFVSIHSIDLSLVIEPGQVLLSLDSENYSPLPVVGQTLKRGEVYAKIKNMIDEKNGGPETVNFEPVEFAVPEDCTITSIEIFQNQRYSQVPEFRDYIDRMVETQGENFKNLCEKLNTVMENEKELEQFLTVHQLSRYNANLGKTFIEKGKKINGTQILIQAVYEEELGVGDKLANRHGGKGVCAKVIPDEDMPILEDGRRIEIIVNPLGIISRMNIGQLYEAHLNEALLNIKSSMKLLDGRRKTKYLKEFLDIIDNTEDKWVTSDILEEYETNKELYGIDFAIDNISLIMPSFEDISAENLFKAMKFSGAKFKQKIYDPVSKINLKNKITVGNMYFFKLVHRASDKLSARSIGPYNRNTLQPLGGKNNKGGHKIGEMENWAFIGHGAFDFLKDMLTVHADSPGLKNKLLASILQNSDLVSHDDSDTKPQSLRLFNAYLNSLGIDLGEKEN